MDFEGFDDFLFNIYVRENSNDDIGFLPGSKEEKLKMVLSPVRNSLTVERFIEYLIKKKKESDDMNKITKILFSPDVFGNGFKFFELDFNVIMYSKKMIGQDVLDSPFAGVKKVSDDCIEIIFLNIFTRDSDKENYLIENLYHLGFKYITRDEDGSLYAWQYKPEKQRDFDSNNSYWYFPKDVVGNSYKIYDTNLFPAIAWGQDEPFDVKI